jgi:hypothetical protein
MHVKNTLAVAGLLTLMGGVAACGGGSSSPAAGSADGPTTASKTAFCSTITNLAQDTTPKELATAFEKVGTPTDIDSSSRHGFEVLVEHLQTLPDNAKAADLTAMEKGLSATDEKDVLAFSTYLTKECVPTGSASGAPSVPSSGSS